MDFHGNTLPRTSDKGVLTVYYPLPAEVVGKGFDNAKAIEIAERAAVKATQIMTPLIAERHLEEGESRSLPLKRIAGHSQFTLYLQAI